MPGDLSVRRHDQFVAEQGGPSEFFHERFGKLRESITDNNCLCHAAKLIQKLQGSGQGVDFGDGLLDLRKAKSMFMQYASAKGHQFIIIRLIPGCPSQFRNSRHLRKGDPDFRYQYTLQVQTHDMHSINLSFLT